MALQHRNLEALTVTSVMTPTTVSSANNTTGVNLSSIDGDALFILQAGTSAASTGIKVQIQHSATQGGTYSDVGGGAFADLTPSATTQALAIPRSGLNGWFRLSFSSLTGSYSASVSCVAVGLPRYVV